jgi:23S rRNA pseudouridine1911/1915/1917 synthase
MLMCDKKNNVTFCSLDRWSSVDELLIGFDGISRSWLKKRISKKKRQQQVGAKQVVEIPISVINYNLIAPYHGEDVIEVVGESKDILALYKPQGVHCYPLSYDDNNTIVNWIRSYDFSLLSVNKQRLDRGLLYRLDQQTSGVLLYAKNNFFYKNVRENFNLQSKKIYLAIVSGKIEQKEAQLKNYLTSYGPDGASMRVVDDAKKGNLATLTYTVLSYFEDDDLSLIEVELKTGLRHQIRVQFSHIGHSILGDNLYRGLEADRMYLHAWKYEINGEMFEAKVREPLFQKLLSLNS